MPKFKTMLVFAFLLTILSVPIGIAKLVQKEPANVSAESISLETQLEKQKKEIQIKNLEKARIEKLLEAEKIEREIDNLKNLALSSSESSKVSLEIPKVEVLAKEEAKPSLLSNPDEAKAISAITEKGQNALPDESNLEKHKTVKVDQNILDKIQSQKEIYLKAKEFGCHPALLAGIHYRETNLGLTNAWNGQGAYQNLANKYPSNSQVDDIDTQTKQACEHLKNKVGGKELMDLNDLELVGKALARYNGCSNQIWNNCGYVVNKLEDGKTFTKCTVDFICYPLVTDTKFGTLTVAIVSYNTIFKL